MACQSGDDPHAAGGAPLVQFIDVGDADVGSGGGVDAGGGGLDQRQPHCVAPQQHQAHCGLVYLDLEPEHLAQECSCGREVVNLGFRAELQMIFGADRRDRMRHDQQEGVQNAAPAGFPGIDAEGSGQSGHRADKPNRELVRIGTE